MRGAVAILTRRCTDAAEPCRARGRLRPGRPPWNGRSEQLRRGKPVEVLAPEESGALAQLPQYRAGNRLKIRVASIFQSLFDWFLSQIFTGRMISVGTPSASYRTLWSGSGVALRRIRRT